MKSHKIAFASMMLALGLAFGPQLAQADLYDDAKWINQCVKDNADEGAPKSVVKKYCFCMVNEMPEEETASVTEWEKKNPKVMNMCSKRAGWK